MSNIARRAFDSLLTSPVETLNTEIKGWFDPRLPEGIAKIAKACIALYNQNGGVFVVGISDDGKTDVLNAPTDLRESFTADWIQSIVAKYASRPFAVELSFHDRDGSEVLLVEVPSGVTSPVACKSDLMQSGKALLRNHAIYVRTIQSNNTVSSSEAKCGDWDDLVRRCFDNREADIGAFFRRQLAAADVQALSTLFFEATHTSRSPSVVERTTHALDNGLARFRAVASEREVVFPSAFGTREAAVMLTEPLPARPLDQDLLWSLQAATPRQSGWPPWLIVPGIGSNARAPYVFDNGFEALINMSEGRRTLDFWRIDPIGEFYHACVLEDDLSTQLVPGIALEPVIVIRRVTEILSTTLAFVRQLGANPETATIAAATRWTGLRGRQLGTWANPQRDFWSAAVAVQDSITTTSELPVGTPFDALSPYVAELVDPIFALFGGHRFGHSVIEDIVRETVNRR